MFQIGKTIVSQELIEEDFVCNLSACKGACCIEGEGGAPLELEETKILESIYPKVKPLLSRESQEIIQREGTHVVGQDGGLETPLVNGGPCVYVIYENNIAKCGIEEAYNKGIIDLKKPVSCHLYPVRVNQYQSFSAVNYHKWYICSAACELGKELKVPVYKFVKEALIRKFGEAWYQELETVANEWKKQQINN